MIWVNIGALFYCFLGLLFFRKTLFLLDFKDSLIALLLLSLLYSTLLLQYSTIQPGWTHIYSFCCASLFFLALIQYQQTGRQSLILVGSLSFALLILIIVIIDVRRRLSS